MKKKMDRLPLSVSSFPWICYKMIFLVEVIEQGRVRLESARTYETRFHLYIV